MNAFVRYFDKEIIAHNPNEIFDFLNSLDDFRCSNDDMSHIIDYMTSSNPYPFRLKVSMSNYVLFLKTDAETIEEFKEAERQRKEFKATGLSANAEKKKSIMDFLNEEHIGWYDASILFKRVVQIPGTSKFQYKDTHFRVRLKATSGMDCYTRITEHLHNRQDVDKRSQFPSVKSNNFEFTFLGDELPTDDNDLPN